MNERNLELTVRYDDDRFEVVVYDPERKCRAAIYAPLRFEEHSGFDRLIGNEIYEWLALWKSAKE